MTGCTELGRTLAIAFGSGAGALARWSLSVDGEAWYWNATSSLLAINAVGSFAIGALSMLDWSRGGIWSADRAGIARDTAMAGFCGGFTAFSLFNVDVLRVAESAGLAAALGLAVVSVALWLAGVAAGRALGRQLGMGRP